METPLSSPEDTVDTVAEAGPADEARDALDRALRIKPDYAPARALSDAYSAYGPQAK